MRSIADTADIISSGICQTSRIHNPDIRHATQKVCRLATHSLGLPSALNQAVSLLASFFIIILIFKTILVFCISLIHARLN